MESRKYDLVVFGATGFAGSLVVEEVAKVADEEKLTWAISGRNMAKLQKILSEVSSRTSKDLEETPIIIADVNSLALFRLFPSASLLVAHLRLNPDPNPNPNP